jgi:tellurite resistance protein TehA-like permease
MKSKIIIIIGLFVIMGCGFSSAYAVEPSMADYTSYPIFQTSAVQPNILIMLDNSEPTLVTTIIIQNIMATSNRIKSTVTRAMFSHAMPSGHGTVIS